MKLGKNTIKLVPNTKSTLNKVSNKFTSINGDNKLVIEKVYTQGFLNGKYSIIKLPSAINRFIEISMGSGYWCNSDGYYLRSGEKPIGYIIGEYDISPVMSGDDIDVSDTILTDIIWQNPLNIFDILDNSIEFRHNMIHIKELNRDLKNYGFMRINTNVNIDVNPLKVSNDPLGELTSLEDNIKDNKFTMLSKEIVDMDSGIYSNWNTKSELTVSQVLMLQYE